MLTVSKALSSGQAQKYHKLEFTSKSQSYYQQGDVVKGEWQGTLAASLGLSGDVAPLEFSRLADGVHPQTEAPMVRHRLAMEYKNPDGTVTKAVEHRAGWDATFSAPKSVSLTALVGGDDRVRDAHRAAVSTALDELERYTQARIGGNNAAETTGKFIAAKFEHTTARPVDGYAAPQLHTHAVIFNLTERADGTTRALQERSFFESQQFATAVYQSSLTYQLRNLGYDIETGRSGAPEIKGYTQEYLDASSPRSQQIKEQMEKTGHSGPEAAEIAAYSTREKKQTLSAQEVLAAHRDMAAAFGDQAQQVVSAARIRAEQQERTPDNGTRAKEAVTFARESIFEREAVADERIILRDAMRRGMGDASYRDIRAEFDQRREAGQFRSVQAMKHSSSRSYTTPETIAAERTNIRSILEGRNAIEPIMSAESAREQATMKTFLNDSQRRVIEEVLNSADRIHGLQGLAGSGKTSSLQSIREGAETAGYKVEGFAPTSRAAGQLREAGIDATTLQSFLARGQNHPSSDPANRHLYMLDESSLASTRQMRSFLDKLNPNDRVLVIGDTRQHQGVDAGRPFQQMQEAGMQTSQLDQIMRQKDPELLRVVEHFSKNETAVGVSLLQQQGRVTEIQNKSERIAAIAKDYAARPQNTLVVSPDNVSRREINDAIRIELKVSGIVSKAEHRMDVLTQRSELTSADRTWAAKYQTGDVLFYSRGSKEQGIEPKSYARVVSVDAATNRVSVVKDDGSQVSYDPLRLRGITAYREISRDFAEGDRIQFTSTNRELGVANRDLGAIQRIDGIQIDVKMDGKEERTVSFDSAKMRHFDHGYTVTSHSSQGLTTDRVLVNMDTTVHPELINTRFAYVSVSRASQDAQIYTNDAANLGKRLSTDVTKNTAVDVQNVQMEDSAKQHNQEPPITKSNPISENSVIPAKINSSHKYDQGLSL
jgi:conjugative relaxase-like TrwC/TraI family protein